MADRTGIQWTQADDGTPGATWNPTWGCSRISPGCVACYAERFSGRFSGPGGRYEGLVRLGPNGPRWTGKMVLRGPEALDIPIRWTRPRRIFVNSMSDLFHEGLTDDQVLAVFGIMALASHHTYLILTKRAERMRRLMAQVATMPGEAAVGCCLEALMRVSPGGGTLPPGRAKAIAASMRAQGRDPDALTWPLPHVWLGVSAEDQVRADERLPDLLRTPAAIRFVSYEPAIGPVDFRPWFASCDCMVPAEEGAGMHSPACRTFARGIDWLIVGGESGPGARPFEVAWMREAIREARAAGAAAFAKQLGSNVRDVNDGRLAPCAESDDHPCAWPPAVTEREDAVEFEPDGIRGGYQGEPVRVRLRDSKGGEMSEWPAYLRVREFPAVAR